MTTIPSSTPSSTPSTPGRWRRSAVALSLVAGGVLGGGLLAGTVSANAADASSSTAPATSTVSTATSTAASTADQSQSQRSDEHLLTGTDATKARAAALAAYPGATVQRVETDSDGVYEAHVVTADGKRLIVQMDAQFTVTGTDQGRGGPAGVQTPAG